MHLFVLTSSKRDEAVISTPSDDPREAYVDILLKQVSEPGVHYYQFFKFRKRWKRYCIQCAATYAAFRVWLCFLLKTQQCTRHWKS